MLKLVSKLIIPLTWLTMASCIAGDGTLRCYSRLYSNPQKVKLAIMAMWNLYPENRVDELSIRKIEKHYPNLFQGQTFIDTSQCETCRSILKSESKKLEYLNDEWYVKSSDGNMIFRLDIANINEWTNGFNCDICIKYVIFMDKAEQNFLSWQLSKEQQIMAKKTFENDILIKLKQTIKTVQKDF